jgi:glucose/arabinose dehydrogenase
MLKHVRNLTILALILGGIVLWFASRPDVAQLPLDKVSGVKPELTAGRPQNIPTINVASVDRWKAGEAPVAVAGLSVKRFAEGLDHPRNLITLPNNDILVAETNSPPKGGGGIKGMVERWLMGKAGAGVPSANRITLLRDADGDGVSEIKSPLLTGLNSPFGMALIGETLYVANTDAVLAFPYKLGENVISAKGKKIANLNAMAPNMHWTRNLLASKDGKKLYVAVGSNSNIAEGGSEIEKARAQILEIDLATNKTTTFAAGLRNPVGMDWDAKGRLWTVVNERDMLGSDMVPDYLTEVYFGADFGWPHHYWGGFTDYRVKPLMENKRQYERRPDYSMGPHVAPLGLVFADKAKLGATFASGAFVARHGSWNRSPASGYDVVFVPFKDGRPTGVPQNVLTGFLDKDGKAQGRPTMLTLANDGALLVSDDVGNIIWRVSSAAPTAAASAK